VSPVPVSSATLALALLVGAPSVTGTLEAAIEDFEFGEHAAAAKKLEGVLDPLRLESAEDVILARQYLGACYFLLERRPLAEAEFAKILALDPEHKLDPEVFSPALVQYFEEVRVRTGLALRPRRAPPTETEPGPGRGPPPTATPGPEDPPVRTLPVPLPPDNGPLALRFVPFGVGQFANRHSIRGALFATAEVGLFATAGATWAMFQGLKVGDQGGRAVFADQDDANRASTLQSIYLTTFYAGLAVVAIGIVEAVLSHPGTLDLGVPARVAPAATLDPFSPSRLPAVPVLLGSPSLRF
jgi:tetratricopeptide (TPR) repeat protein